MPSESVSNLRVVSGTPRVWMTKQQIADHLQISVRTVDTWRAERGMPAHKRAGLVRFDRLEVDEWLAAGGSMAA